MDIESRIIDDDFLKPQDLCSSGQYTGSGQFQSFKTQTFESNFELCQTIKQIKTVKIGKKRELKLMLENTEKLQYHAFPTRLKDKKGSFRSESSMSIHSQSTRTQKTNKKIVKSNQKIVSKRKNLPEEITQIQHNSFYPHSCQNEINKTLLVQENILAYKGMHLFQSAIQGMIGHSTLIFSNHITEGSYYLQFKILQSCAMGNQLYKNKPHIRIGMCERNHPQDIPLGFKNSIGFHVNKKIMITQGQEEKLSSFNQQIIEKPIKSGDIIGMQLQFSPPYKHADRSKTWQDSSMKFFLNGQPMGQYKQIKQMFYHPAISLYNGACVEIRTRQSEMDFLPIGCLAYEKISQYINTYK